MVVLTSGHFAGGVGATSFVNTHKSDLLGHVAAAVTIEHLGAEEWLPGADGHLAATGKAELAAIFTPSISALTHASEVMLWNADAAPGFVMPPLNLTGDGTADNAVWPGEGQYLWGLGKIPTANYITGPTYLLNWGITTADKVDYERMRRESIAFAQMILDLSRFPATSLQP